jgi:tight adherence protein C
MMEGIFATQGTGADALRVAAATAFTFVAVFLLVLAISSYVRARAAVRRRAVAASLGGSGAGAAFAGGDPGDARSIRYQNLSDTSALLGDVERGASRSESESSKIKRELLRAGFFGTNAVLWYQTSRAVLLVAGALLGYFGYTYFYPEPAMDSQIIAAVLLGSVAFLMPSRFVSERKKRLGRECREGFPDFIDLMIVCAEAGLGARSAIDRLSREIAKTYPILGAHLYLASLEIRAGSSLHQALFSLSRRTHVEEAGTLAALLEQTEQLGTSVTDALRVYRDEMRERRVVRAEEKAHALPAKLVLPLGIFVFPVILIVVLLPAIVRMKEAGY